MIATIVTKATMEGDNVFTVDDNAETFGIHDSNSDSDNDEPILISRQKHRARLDDDSDEEEKGSNTDGLTSSITANLAETNGNIEETMNASPLQQQKINKRRIINFDESSDEDDKPLKSYEFRKSVQQESNRFDKDLAKEPEDVHILEGETLLAARDKKILANSDLFDAEGSSDEERAGHNNSEKDSDEEIGLQELKKKAKNSVTKRGNTERDRKLPKPKKGDLKQLHSESQRIVRQSRVSLPYHVPQQRTLDEFLNRRKNIPSSIRPNAKEVESILKKCSKAQQKHTADTETQKSAISSANIDQRSSLARCNLDEEISNVEVPSILPPIPSIVQDVRADNACMDKELLHKDAQPIEDEDSLPDLSDTLCIPKSPENSTGPLPSVIGFIPEAHPRISDGDACVANLDEHPQSPLNEPKKPLNSNETTSISLEENFPESATTENLETCNVEAAMEVELPDKLSTPISEKLESKKFQIPLEMVAGFTPKLSGTPHTIINLDEKDEEKTPRFQKLVEAESGSAGRKNIVLSILKKEKNADGEEQLVNENITVNIDGAASQNPNYTLLELKEVLKMQIAKRRTEARQKRLLLQAEDNEEGFDGDKDCDNEEEEEEEILSDITDSEEGEDTDADDECEIIGREINKKVKAKNKFIDDEAEDENGDIGKDEDDEEDCLLGEEVEDEVAAHKRKKRSDVRLRLQLDSDSSDEESLLPPVSSQKRSLSRCSTVDLFPQTATDIPLDENDTKIPEQSLARDTSMDSSFELMGSLIPAFQPGGGMRHNQNQSQSTTALTRQYSSLLLPIENSQDLFTQNSFAEASTYFPISPVNGFSTQASIGRKSPEALIQRKLEFCNTKSVSTQENEDELFGLCSGKWQETATEKVAGIGALCDPPSPKDTQETMDELADLCSGKFQDPTANSVVATNASFIPPTPKDTQDAMDQLMNLCSGKFVESSRNVSLSQGDCSSITATGNNTQKEFFKSAKFDKSDDDDDDNLSISSLLSEDPRRQRRITKRVLSDSESEEEKSDNFSEIEDEGDIQEEKENKLMKEFFEDEAELSGSDVPSDEDDDIAKEDDVLDEELGDLEELSEDELKNQVEKVHMKMMMDDDQKRLRLYKEMYLEDGDLHTEGMGRVRKFRWRNVDEDSNLGDEYKANSDSEGEDGENDAENAKYRILRHEREKWLREQKLHLDDLDDFTDNNSNLCKRSKKFKVLSRHNSSVINRSDSLNADSNSSSKKNSNNGDDGARLKKFQILNRQISGVMQASNSPNVLPNLSPKRKSTSFCGSFLARGKDALARIAAMTKDHGKEDNLLGPRNSRSLLFTTVSPKKDTQDSTPKLSKASSTPLGSIAKKPRLEMTIQNSISSRRNSIFDLL